MPRAASASAISCSRLTILLILTPGAGTISYKVTTGPGVTVISSIFISKRDNLSFKSSAFRVNSSSSTLIFSSGEGSSRLMSSFV